MNLYIPKLKTKIELIKDWNFTLHKEYRNDTFYKRINNVDDWQAYHALPDTTNVTLKEGSILSVERVYIRSGQSNYDSVTFVLLDSPQRELVTQPKAKPRFWVKLDDANNVEFKLFEG
jgi:hypothetical protein